MVDDITPLHSMKALRTLALSSTRVSDLSPLAGLTALTYLSLSDCTQVVDASPLKVGLRDFVLFAYVCT
jgi:hypothetical protein